LGSQHKGLTEQDLAHIQAIGPGSLLAANPVFLTFTQPDPSEPNRFYPCKYIKLDNFLPQEINQAILQHAITHQDKFVPSRSYSKNNTEAESLKFTSLPAAGLCPLSGVWSPAAGKNCGCCSPDFR